MEIVLAVVVAVLYGAGFYLCLRRSTVKLVLGLALLGHAANVLIFTVGGLGGGEPPIVPVGENSPHPGHADPVPQSLILTAIVIGFGVQAFLLVLVKRAWIAQGTDDLDTVGEDER